MYGRPSGEIAPELKAAVLGDGEMNTKRPGSLIEPGWEKAKAETAGLARSEEDVMTYALFPELAPAFLQKKYQQKVSITPFWGDRVLINHLMQVAERRRVKYETGR